MNNKLQYIRFFVTVPLIFINLFVVAQIEYAGEPGADKSHPVSYIQLPHANRFDRRVSGSDQAGGNYKSDIFAEVFQVGIDPSMTGEWHRCKENLLVWRIGFTSEGATSLGLNFTPYRLKSGVRVFVYTADPKRIMGAFTFRNNKSHRGLAVASLPGDSIIVEIQTINDPKDIGDLKISTVSIGFLEDHHSDGLKDQYYGWSADCHLDINCTEKHSLQEQKFSVCRLVIEEQGIRKRCTGTLLNNEREDGKPYVLTAGHCVSSDYGAQNTIFSFDYESPYCDGSDGEILSISGSYLRSRGEFLDFALLEMGEEPPVDYTPVFSGWNAGIDVPGSSYSIHHPEGDVKKFSMVQDPVLTGSFSPYEPNTFWLVESYEAGSTENGSSGAALFNQENQVVGTLTGGGTVCSDPIDDYYQQFREAWAGSADPENQLKYWLDPDDQGIASLNNLDPYGGITELLSNITEDDPTALLPMEEGWGYVSGHNSLGSRQFAETFLLSGSKYVYAVRMKVGRAWSEGISKRINAESGTSIDSLVFMKLLLWSGEEEPAEILYEKGIYPFELEAGPDNYLRLDTLILVNEKFFVGYEIFYTGSKDTFAICTGNPDPALNTSPALMNAGSGWSHLNDGSRDLNLSLDISPAVLDYFPKPGVGTDEFPFEEVTLYPNPAYDRLQILFEDQPEDQISLKVFDMYGNIVYQKTYNSPTPNIQLNIANVLISGMYILIIESGESITVKKFIRL